MEQKLEQRQTQKLMLTQGLAQAIKLLSLASMELSSYLEQAVSENPLLEFKEKSEIPEGREESQASDDSEEDGQAEPSSLNQPDNIQRKKDYRESLITQPPSVEEGLLHQLHMLSISPQDYKIGELIIGNINDDGYLNISVDEIAKSAGATIADVERVLGLIRTFEPPGIASRNLSECLSAQLQYYDIDNSAAEKIIKNYLPELAKRNYKKIASALKLKIADVEDARRIIESLDPKPASRIYAKEAGIILPDIEIKLKESDADIRITDTIPDIKINEAYKKILAKKDGTKKDKTYLKEHLKEANMLISALKRRNETLMRVSEEIFSRQREFLQEGPSSIRPLRLKDISAKLGIHESTVSRIVSTKYADTPFGIYPLRFFFSRESKTESGAALSSNKIKYELSEILKKDAGEKPLSDEAIVKLLGLQGIKIARRTIAKYRTGLKILPSHLRKK